MSPYRSTRMLVTVDADAMSQPFIVLYILFF